MVVWWWRGEAWALISVEDRDGSLTGIGVAWRGGSSGYLFCLWVKIEWVCGGDRGTSVVGFGRSTWRCDWL